MPPARAESRAARAAGKEIAERQLAVPAQCVACGGSLVSWRIAEPQDPAIPHRYPLVRCQACGTASTAGEADPALYETGVYSAATTRVAALIDAHRALYERHKLWLLRRSLPPPAEIVELGAGQGRFVALASAAGYSAVGVEPSRRSVEIAASRGIRLEHSSLEDAQIGPGSLDAVVLWHVLEHLDDPGAALERVRSWLRPGGAVVIGVPNLASWQARVGGARWLHLDVPRHRHHFTPAGLEALLGRHGLAAERTTHLLFEHNPFGMWQAWLDRATTTPSYAYNLIKRNARPNARDLVATALVALLLPFAVVVELVAGLARRGGTIAVVARSL